METILKLKLFADGKVELSHIGPGKPNDFANAVFNEISKTSDQEWNDLDANKKDQYTPDPKWHMFSEDSQYNIISNPAIVKVPATAPSSYGYAVNQSTAVNELTKKIYTLTAASKILQFPSVNVFTRDLLFKKYIKHTGRKPSGHNYYTYYPMYNNLFYQKTPCQPVYVTQNGVKFFKDKLKIKD